MGRYCFFNTDVEYKFWFGCQSSSDVEAFGGCVKRCWRYDPRDWHEQYIVPLNDEDDDREAGEDSINEMKDIHNQLLLWANGRDQFDEADLSTFPPDVDMDEFLDWGHHWIGMAYEEVLELCLELMAEENKFYMLPEDLNAWILSFPRDAAGTAKLIEEVCTNEHFNKEDLAGDDWSKYPAIWAKWNLGVVIAHQLLYEPNLACCYEIA